MLLILEFAAHTSTFFLFDLNETALLEVAVALLITPGLTKGL